VRCVKHSPQVLNNPENGSVVNSPVPVTDGLSQPDICSIRKNVPVLAVARAVGLSTCNRQAKCWRLRNHTHAGAHPSLHFYGRDYRARHFGCDMYGGHSCLDPAMGALGIGLRSAVRLSWFRLVSGSVLESPRPQPPSTSENWQDHPRVRSVPRLDSEVRP
jgi:hypothetical protein